MKTLTSSHLPWIIVGVAFFLSRFAEGQVTPTPGSFEAQGGFGNSGLITIPASAGKLSGTNLLHSFDTFNINGTTITGAQFTDAGMASTINNVVARVTGGSASTINGALSTAHVAGGGFAPNVNLFLVNPQGVIFGPNASISVPGNFVASTANYVVLGDQTHIFYADPSKDSTSGLTISSGSVSAFGFFAGTTPKPIVVAGAQLNNPGGLQFIGGNFTAAPDSTGTAPTLKASTLGIFSVGTAGAGVNATGTTDVTKDSTVPYLTAAVTKYTAGGDFTKIQNTTSFGKVTFGSTGNSTILGTAISKGSAKVIASGANGHVVIRGGTMVVQNGSSLTAPSTGGAVDVGSTDFTLDSGSAIGTGGGGAINLLASGNVSDAGTISAAGTESVTATGGNVVVTGAKVHLAPTAVVNVSGNAGGGTAKIGGGAHGKDASIANAQTTTIDAGAQIIADALRTGNAGQVVVWSDNDTEFFGNISAQGGAVSGNGGNVEVSGDYLNFQGVVDTLAANGSVGNLLLDPAALTVTTGGTGTIDAAGDNDATSTTLDPMTIHNSLGTTNVTLSATNSITVSSDIAWTSPHSLELDSALITTDAAITGTGNNAVLKLVAGAGGAQLNQGTNIMMTGTNGTLSIASSGGAEEGGTGTVNVTNLVVTGSGDLTISAGTIGTAAVSLTSGNIMLTQPGSLAVGTVGTTSGITTSSGTILLQTRSTGSLTLSQGLGASGLITLNYDQGVTGSGVITATTLALEGGGGATLTGASHVTNLSAVGTYAGDVSFSNGTHALNLGDGSNALNVGTHNVTLTAGGLTQNEIVTAGILTLSGGASSGAALGTLNNAVAKLSTGTSAYGGAINFSNGGTALLVGDGTNGINVGTTNSLALKSTNGITQNAAITAGTLTLSGGGTAALATSSNTIANVTTGGATYAGAISLNNGSNALVVGDGTNSLDAGTHNVTLATTGGITQNEPLKAGTLTLSGGGTAALATSANTISNLTTGATAYTGAISFNNGATALTIGDGTHGLNAGTHNVTLATSGSLSQNAAITSGTLTLSGGGSVALGTSNNSATHLTTGGTAATGDINFNNGGNALVIGDGTNGLDAGSHNIALRSTGAITQNKAITGGILTLTGGGGATLSNTGNAVSALSTGGATYAGSITLNNGSTDLVLGNGSGVDVGGNTLSVTTSGAITQNGAVAAGTLSTSAGNGITLNNGSNNVGSFNATDSSATGITFNDGTGLTITSPGITENGSGSINLQSPTLTISSSTVKTTVGGSIDILTNSGDPSTSVSSVQLTTGTITTSGPSPGGILINSGGSVELSSNSQINAGSKQQYSTLEMFASNLLISGSSKITSAGTPFFEIFNDTDMNVGSKIETNSIYLLTANLFIADTGFSAYTNPSTTTATQVMPTTNLDPIYQLPLFQKTYDKTAAVYIGPSATLSGSGSGTPSLNVIQLPFGSTVTLSVPMPSFGVVLDGGALDLATGPDNLHGATLAVNTGADGYTYTLDDSDGTDVSGTLYLSLSALNINSYETLNFGLASINNVVIRVTGGAATLSDNLTFNGTTTSGSLHVTIDDPAGVNVNGGGFTGASSTQQVIVTLTDATSLSIGGGGTFLPTTTAVNLTGNAAFAGAVNAINFDGTNASSSSGISTAGAVFATALGQRGYEGVQLVGTGISVNNSSLYGDNVNLVSVGGRVISIAMTGTDALANSGFAVDPISPSVPASTLGPISITNGSIIGSAVEGPASMDFVGKDFTLQDSFVIDQTLPGNTATNIYTPPAVSVDADTVTIFSDSDAQDAFISTSTEGTPAGVTGASLSITANSLSIYGSGGSTAVVGLLSQADPTVYFNDGDGTFEAYAPLPVETGDAGAMTLNIAQSLVVTGGAQITSASYGNGNGGNITIGTTTIPCASVQIGGNLLDSTSTVIASGTGVISSSASISTTGETVTTAGTGGSGNVTINAGTVMLTGAGSLISTSTAATGTSGNAGSIVLNASGTPGVATVSVQSGAQITASTTSGGNGGSVTLNLASGDVSLNSGQINASTSSSGQGGDIAIYTPGHVSITNGSQVNVSSAGTSGGAGTITIGTSAIPTASLTVDGYGSGIEANANGSVSSGPSSTAITINTGTLTLSNYGLISTDSAGFQNAGGILINCDVATITGGTTNASAGSNDFFESSLNSGIFSQNDATIASFSEPGYTYSYVNPTSNPDPSASAGNITLNATTSITLMAGGQINATSYGAGSTGTVNIGSALHTVPTLLVDGFTSGIFAQAEGFVGGGAIAPEYTAISIYSGALTISNFGLISTDTLGNQTAGDIDITSDTITIAGQNTLPTFASNYGGLNSGIYSQNDADTVFEQYTFGGNFYAYDFLNTGNFGSASVSGANITLKATTSLSITGGGQINATSFGTGSPGTIMIGTLTAPVPIVSVSDFNSGILAQSDGTTAPSTGPGAPNTAITIFAGALSLSNYGLISTDSFGYQTAGGIAITSNSLTITGGSGLPSNVTNFGLNINSGIYSQDDAFTQITQNGNNVYDYINTNANDPTANAAGGTVTVTTGALTVTADGQINTQTFGAGLGGSMVLTVNGAATISHSGEITASTSGSGSGGTISLAVTGVTNGPAGTGDLSVTSGGIITASSSSTGDAGSITIAQSGSTDITAPSLNPATNGGLFLNNGTISTAASGQGNNTNASLGNIVLEVQAVTGFAGSQINASTSGQSNAGSVTITGPSGGSSATQFVALSGGSNIASQTLNVFGNANANDVNSTSPYAGQGGTITLYAGSLTLDGSTTKLWTASANGYTGTPSVASNNGTINSMNGGDGGTINLNIAAVAGTIGATGNVNVSNGASISASSLTTGAAGTVNINAKNVAVDGLNSNISTDAGPIGSINNGLIPDEIGAVNLTAQTLSLSNGAVLSARTGGYSPGGTITIDAPGSVSLTNNGIIDASSSASQAVADANAAYVLAHPNAVDPAFGAGGSIIIGGPNNSVFGLVAVPNANSPSVLSILNDSHITASSLATTGGTITIYSGTADIEHNSSIETKGDGTTNNGGDILINAEQLFYLNDFSDISTHSGGVGGNITIDPQFEILNHSFVDAFGGNGDGNVVILSNFTLSADSSITASGTVTIASFPLDLSGSLAVLPADLTDEAKRLRESCARAVNHEFSSLIVVGRSGTETAPDELNSDSGSADGGAAHPPAVRSQEKLR